VERVNKSCRSVESDAKYEGEWHPETNLPDGHGVQAWADGARYEGSWKDGK